MESFGIWQGKIADTERAVKLVETIREAADNTEGHSFEAYALPDEGLVRVVMFGRYILPGEKTYWQGYAAGFIAAVGKGGRDG